MHDTDAAPQATDSPAAAPAGTATDDGVDGSTTPEPAPETSESTSTRPGWAARMLRRLPNRPLIAILAVIVVALAANIVLYLRGSDQSETSSARTAAQATVETNLPKVLSYDFSALGGYQQAVEADTTGGFHDQLATFVRDQVIPAATQQQIVTTTTVAASSVVRADPEQVRLLLYLNQSTTSRNTPTPSVQGVRVEVGMSLVNGQWLISDMTPV